MTDKQKIELVRKVTEHNIQEIMKVSYVTVDDKLEVRMDIGDTGYCTFQRFCDQEAECLLGLDTPEFQLEIKEFENWDHIEK